MIERKGNYIDGTTMQMDYDEVLKMVQVAYIDKKYELQHTLEASWPTDTYSFSDPLLTYSGKNRYHQHTRGLKVAQLGKEFERIAVILHHLQALGVGKQRQANFHWWFNKGDEEE
jgi:hypothetical protein